MALVDAIMQCLADDIKIYEKISFNVTLVFVDRQYSPLRDSLILFGITFIIMAANAHVTNIDRGYKFS